MTLHDVMEQQEVITLPFVFEKMLVKTVKICKDDMSEMIQVPVYVYK